jgi:hypothetical protein
MLYPVADTLPAASIKNAERAIPMLVLPNIFFWTHTPIGIGDLMIAVAEQRKAQMVPVIEFFLLGHLVRTDADSSHAGGL